MESRVSVGQASTAAAHTPGRQSRAVLAVLAVLVVRFARSVARPWPLHHLFTSLTARARSHSGQAG
ncbi:MAG TPA: hypothetical protein VFW76_06850 [Ktedonobacterales bacterium]|nr:hypothetical protein [Ktedonobacterales bacterium]